MRDGTGTFEPISRDWFTTDPRRDAPNAGVYSTSSSSSSSPLHTRSVHRRRRPKNPIRSDPIRSNRPRAHGWEPMMRRGTILSGANRAIAGRARRHRRFRVRSRREKQTRRKRRVASRRVVVVRQTTNVPGRDGGAHGEGHLPSIARAWICRPHRAIARGNSRSVG